MKKKVKSDNKQFYWLVASWFAFYWFGLIVVALQTFNKQFDLVFLFGMLFSMFLLGIVVKNLRFINKW